MAKPHYEAPAFLIAENSQPVCSSNYATAAIYSAKERETDMQENSIYTEDVYSVQFDSDSDMQMLFLPQYQ
ncbi:unnamed protein product [Brugia pahangi]|uniref:Uncharacterized protein n=1 Tax=Brugia pahangi TaxID=6280 RepID=A0A0N4TNE5_BRUPA|nr:unnamed protein product [Brugia pahangi]